MEDRTNQVKHGLVFVVLLGIGVALFSSTILRLQTISSQGELYSHIPLIPFVSLYFFLAGRKSVFCEVKWGPLKGLAVMAGALAVYWLGRHLEGHVNEHNYLSIMMSGLFIWILGTFLFTCGNSASRKGAFPLLFLVFIIPIPTPILDPFVRLLQHGSAEFSHVIFKVIGVPLHRDGLLFSLPGLTIEVAEQCSGIRSSMALLITGVVAGRLFLSKGWARLALLLSVFPISMFKNSLRIVMLSLLAAYVDPGFITGSWLHNSGGILFFVLGLLLLLPVLWGIRKWEERALSSLPGGAREETSSIGSPLSLRMDEPEPLESVMEFIPVLKGSDARGKRFGSRRFSPYRAALFLQDLVVVCLGAWGGLWAGGLASVAVGRPVQYGFVFVLGLMTLGFYPTFHLYEYRYVFMTKTHLLNLLKALFWGFVAVGTVAAVYRYPHVLDTAEILIFVGASGVGFLLVSRFYLGELLHILKALGMAFVVLGLFGLVLPEESPLIADEGAAFLWTMLVTFSAVVVCRYFTVHLVFNNWLRRRFRRQVAIVGSDEEARRIAEHIVANKAPFWVAGFLGHPDAGSDDNLPRSKTLLGQLKDLPSVVHREALDDIIVTDEGIEKRVLISLLDYCTSEGLSVWFSPKLLPIINIKVYIDNFCGIPMIRLCSQKREWVFNNVKRGLDVLITLSLCAVLLPFFLLVGLAIKLNSSGPVFYRAAAIGKDGRQFVMHKFRSMRVDSDNAIHKDYVSKFIKGEIRAEGNEGKALKITDDPRITWVGGILRRTSMDELPQLFDVLRGDMSLIGPRPCLPYEYEIYEDWHKKRLSIRPGITGLWQVAGRSEVGFEDMVLLDLYYAYNRSLSMDMSILYETVFAVLGSKGAY